MLSGEKRAEKTEIYPNPVIPAPTGKKGIRKKKPCHQDDKIDLPRR